MNPDQIAVYFVQLAGMVTVAIWALWGALWLACKALDGIVLIVGRILPAFPKAFRTAFVTCLLERRERKEAQR
jgi:cytochrome bd-type quinol oxidase subunit 2